MGLIAQLLDDLAWYTVEGGPRGRLAAACSRNFWVCAVYRIGHAARGVRTPGLGHLARAFYGALNMAVSTITSADIRSGAVIGRHFSVHTYRGLLITNGVVIGDDCVVNGQVCIVNQGNDKGLGVPRLGNHVRVGVGAKLMGGITVGDYVRIGANAVVIRDVPAHHIAVGVPASNKPAAFAKDVPAAAAPPAGE